MSDELFWRSPAAGDIREIEQLAARSDEAAGTLDAVLVGELADRLEWDGGIENVSRVAFAGGQLVAAGWARMMAAPGGVRACLYSFAEPGHAAGQELIRWLDANCVANVNEARVERILAPATADLPRGVTAYWESLGYQEFYVELEMARGISAVSPPIASESAIEIASWSAGLREETRRTYNDAFSTRGFEGFTQDQWEQAFVPGEDFRVALSFVAMDRGSVVGFIFADVREGRDGWTDPTLLNCGWIDSLGVRPSHMRRSAGTGLMGAACEAMRVAGVERVALRVNEVNKPAVNLYRRLGFATERKHVVYRRVC